MPFVQKNLSTETTLKKSKNRQTLKKPQPHKTTNPVHQEDFVYLEKPHEDFTALKLISGPFASIVYKYGNVGFAPESEAIDGQLPMRFDYTVIENKIEADTDSQEFVNHIVDVLLVLLEEQMKDNNESA